VFATDEEEITNSMFLTVLGKPDWRTWPNSNTLKMHPSLFPSWEYKIGVSKLSIALLWPIMSCQIID
jgi:hypothetical protein